MVCGIGEKGVDGERNGNGNGNGRNGRVKNGEVREYEWA
jgi:hypothetical protein